MPTYFSTTRESCWSLMRWLPLKFIFLIFGSFAANSTCLSAVTGLIAEAGEEEPFGGVSDVLLASAFVVDAVGWTSVSATDLPVTGASSCVGACVCKGGTFITAGVAERIGNCTQLSLGLGA